MNLVDIEFGLHQLGVNRGDILEVHSSLSSFGWVEGGAATVVDALMNEIILSSIIQLDKENNENPIPPV